MEKYCGSGNISEIVQNLMKVHISGHLKDYTKNKRDFAIEDSENVLKMVDELNKLFPGIKDRIFDDHDRTREFVNIFVNGESIRDKENEMTKLNDGDQIHILPSVAGGLEN